MTGQSAANMTGYMLHTGAEKMAIQAPQSCSRLFWVISLAAQHRLASDRQIGLSCIPLDFCGTLIEFEEV